jgi:predicted nucleic-acid-binding protein
MNFLDTSILIRYFTQDDPRKANRCEQLFRHAESGRTTLYLTHLAVAETVWVLSKAYRMPKAALTEGIRRLLNTPNVVCEKAPLILVALDLFEIHDISFIDAYHAVILPAQGITTLYSYDTDFDQIPAFKRREP